MAAVLVTGGAGWLGSAIVGRLAARGEPVVALDNFQAGSPANLEGLGAGVRLVSGDLTDLGGLLDVVKAHRIRRIVHAAAIVSVVSSLAAPAHVTRVNLEGTLNVLEAMRLLDVERTVHISSEETYGDFRYEPADEEHPLTPTAPYGIAKVASEHLGRFYKTAYRAQFISVRTSWVYGPGFPRLRVPRTLIEAALEHRPLHLASGGDARIDHTYRDDCVDGVLLALDHASHPFDVYNVSSGQAWSTAEMVAMVRELIPGADLSVGPGPHWFTAEMPAPRKGALDLRRAREVLGYQPKYDLRRGLATTIEWYRRGRPMPDAAQPASC